MRDKQPDDVPGTWHADVFLAYASEDQKLARATQAAMNDYPTTEKGGTIFVKPWALTAEPTVSILGSLEKSVEKFDFGVFLYTPLDRREERGVKQLVARDNVVFETGLFIGKKGRSRVLLLMPDNYPVGPSDLDGIIGIKYPYDQIENADHEQSKTLLWDASAKIVTRIQQVAETPEYRQRPDTQPPPAITHSPQPVSPLELLGAALVTDAGRRKLAQLDDGSVNRGRLVVHAIHGVGQVEGYDPPNRQPRYITVRFASSTGVFDVSELFIVNP
jgi:predicted nucleotide-binding protein